MSNTDQNLLEVLESRETVFTSAHHPFQKGDT